ncbi:unnamed protein product, partial [Musa acuminata var. zebrina]
RPGASKEKSPEAAARFPTVTPLSRCCLRFLKLECIKDCLLHPQEEKNESKVDDLRWSPVSVGSLEELIGESHPIISSSCGSEYHHLERGCSILVHNKSQVPLEYHTQLFQWSISQQSARNLLIVSCTTGVHLESKKEG